MTAAGLCVLLPALLLALLLPQHRAHAQAERQAQAEKQAQAGPFRLCADKDNLPFSSSDPATPGIYIEIGQRIAAALGRPFEPVWTLTYFGKHQVRTELLAGHCDAFVGLPETADFMGPRVIMSQPILALGYGIVSPRGAPAHSVADLVGKRVAVQFDSPAQDAVATRTDMTAVTVLSPEEAMRDLVAHKADDAFIWAPSAGWIDRSALHDAYLVVPVSGPGMQWRSAIGFRSDATALRDAVDRVLPEVLKDVPALEAKYGFPAAAAR